MKKTLRLSYMLMESTLQQKITINNVMFFPFQLNFDWSDILEYISLFRLKLFKTA